MNLVLAAGLSLLSVSSIADASVEFTAKRYQQADGSITVYVDGHNVDPYFSIKALLAARSHGLDIRKSALAWIDWLMPRQLPDGRFERYCREPGKAWKSCDIADADDALLALWLELLYTLSPDSGLPASWRQSADWAEKHLARLADRKRGIYRVSRDIPQAYLMDNVEIYAALKVIAQNQKRFGQHEKSRQTARRADRLRRAIDREFWLADSRRYRSSLHENPDDRFYPDNVAQIYPWLAEMTTPAGSHWHAYWRWHRQYAEEWLTLEQDEFPWGLVALASLKFDDRTTAYQWYASASPLRHSSRWNILEEAAYQAIGHDLNRKSAAYSAFKSGSEL